MMCVANMLWNFGTESGLCNVRRNVFRSGYDSSERVEECIDYFWTLRGVCSTLGHSSFPHFLQDVFLSTGEDHHPAEVSPELRTGIQECTPSTYSIRSFFYRGGIAGATGVRSCNFGCFSPCAQYWPVCCSSLLQTIRKLFFCSPLRARTPGSI